MNTDNDLDSRMRTAFEGNFLDATDIKARGEITVEIAAVSAPGDEKDETGKPIKKTILTFKGAKKRLIVNKTNAKIIATKHGLKASLWIGQKITLVVRYLPEAFGQKNVPVVRVKPDNMSELTFGMRKKYGNESPSV